MSSAWIVVNDGNPRIVNLAYVMEVRCATLRHGDVKEHGLLFRFSDSSELTVSWESLEERNEVLTRVGMAVCSR